MHEMQDLAECTPIESPRANVGEPPRCNDGASSATSTVHSCRAAGGDQPQSDERLGGHSATYVWYVIILLAIVNVFNYVDRMALAVLMPSIKVDLQLSDAQLGLLVGLAFSLFYAICGLPIARLADVGVRRNIIAAALVAWSVMTALSGAAQNFWQLFLTRMGIGAGEAGCLPPAQSMICDYVPLDRRAYVFAIHSSGLYAGMMLGMVMAGWLGELIGWRWAFVALGLPGIVLALIVKVTVREPQRGLFDSAGKMENSLSFQETIKILWNCRTYRLLMWFLAVNGFVQYALVQWWPSFFSRVFGLGLSSLGIQVGLAIGAGSGLGVLIGGTLANSVVKRDARSPLIIGAAATSLALPVSFMSLFVASASSSIVLISVTTLLWSVSSGPVVATVYSVVDSRMRAMAGAITIFCTSVLGFGFGPLCVGILSDLLAPRFGVNALRYALLVPVALLPVMAIMLYAATKGLESDLRAVGARAQ